MKPKIEVRQDKETFADKLRKLETFQLVGPTDRPGGSYTSMGNGAFRRRPCRQAD